MWSWSFNCRHCTDCLQLRSRHATRQGKGKWLSATPHSEHLEDVGSLCRQQMEFAKTSAGQKLQPVWQIFGLHPPQLLLQVHRLWGQRWRKAIEPRVLSVQQQAQLHARSGCSAMFALCDVCTRSLLLGPAWSQDDKRRKMLGQPSVSWKLSVAPVAPIKLTSAMLGRNVVVCTKTKFRRVRRERCGTAANLGPRCVLFFGRVQTMIASVLSDLLLVSDRSLVLRRTHQGSTKNKVCDLKTKVWRRSCASMSVDDCVKACHCEVLS